MTGVRELLEQKDHVFLDFDGPVCPVFAVVTAREVADRLKQLVGPGLPRDVSASADPFDVLRYAASCGPNTANVVERQLRRLELEAVSQVSPAPGVAAALGGLAAQGFTVTIVSNNSAEAVRAFLTLHDLVEHVGRISSRTTSDPDHLKPNPPLLEAAMRAFGASPGQCVMIGDSPADIQAAQAAGIASIALAPTLAKRETLAALGPDALVAHLADLRLAG
jgi:HAD superfamily hydrolase (TIGR01662 family)